MEWELFHRTYCTLILLSFVFVFCCWQHLALFSNHDTIMLTNNCNIKFPEVGCVQYSAYKWPGVVFRKWHVHNTHIPL